MQSIEGIILSKQSYSEADEIITCYSKELGKIRLRARGVKKSRAKLAGSLQQFNWVKIHFVEGKLLPIITETSTIESFPALKGSLKNLNIFSSIANFVDRAIPYEGADALLWCELIECAAVLNNREISLQESLQGAFIWRFLALHGFRPELDKCIACGAKTVSFFSPQVGGGLCNKCIKVDPTALKIDTRTILILNLWASESIGVLASANAEKTWVKNACGVVREFSQWHLGIPTEPSIM